MILPVTNSILISCDNAREDYTCICYSFDNNRHWVRMDTNTMKLFSSKIKNLSDLIKTVADKMLECNVLQFILLNSVLHDIAIELKTELLQYYPHCTFKIKHLFIEEKDL